MREIVWMTVNRHQVVKLTKNAPDLKRGEIPVKLVIEVDEAAFQTPTIEQHIRITDWREGLVFADPHLLEGVITEEEAAIIRTRRLEAMAAALAEHGYTVEPPDDDSGAEFD